MPEQPVKVSLIATVRNEGESITAFVQSLMEQSILPDEIIIVDGGSVDDTVEQLNGILGTNVPIRVIVAPGCNIAQGRNIAIRAARYPIISVADAGCTARPDWLERILQPFQSDPDVDVVSGYYLPAPQNDFEAASARFIYRPPHTLTAATFLPSSRSIAFTRSAWEGVGGYPEHLLTGEDTLFDVRLKRNGAKFALALDAVVLWRPRTTLVKFLRMKYNYAIGDGKAGLVGGAHVSVTLRSLLMLMSVVGVIAGIGWGWLVVGLYLMVFLSYDFRYVRRFLTTEALSFPVHLPSIVMWLIPLRLGNDMAVMCGTWVGVVIRQFLK